MTEGERIEAFVTDLLKFFEESNIKYDRAKVDEWVNKHLRTPTIGDVLPEFKRANKDERTS